MHLPEITRIIMLIGQPVTSCYELLFFLPTICTASGPDIVKHGGPNYHQGSPQGPAAGVTNSSREAVEIIGMYLSSVSRAKFFWWLGWQTRLAGNVIGM